MKILLEQKKWIIGALLFFLLLTLGFQYPKIHFTLIALENRNDWLNLFFESVTFLGDGIFVLLLTFLLFLFRKKVLATLALSSFLLSGLLAQIIKRSLNFPRPSKDKAIQQILLDLNLNLDDFAKWKSFPSGHTTSAFALAFILIMNLPKQNGKLSIIILAFGVGISRIYLIQHYFIDVYFGAILGIISALFVQTFQPWIEKKWHAR